MTKDYKDISLQDLILEEQRPVQVEEPATEPQDESILPTPPTGTRINKRGKNIILLAGAGLGIYIIWAIFHLSPKVETASPSAADSMNISSTSLDKQQQQGDGLVTSLRVQAYGSASTPLQGTPEGSATANLPIPAGAVAPQQQAPTQQTNVPGNLSTVTQNQSSSSQGSSFGGFGGNTQQQTPYQQAVQNGMQSGLTPDGFQTGNSGSSQNAPAQPAMNPVSPAAAPQAAPAAASDNQNMQGEKNAFLQSAQSPTQSTLQGGVQNPASPYMVMAGSVIPATLITGINSDLPGQIQAIVSQNVYDSSTGNSVLIPQGARLVGQYDSQVAYGQSRVLIVWSRIIFPNDQSLDLQGMPGADLSGFAGLHDQVDNHYIRIFGSALLMSVFSAGMQLSQPQTSSVNGASPSNQQIIAGAMGQELSQTATQMIQQNLNIQPTLNIRPGDNFNVLVTRDIPFSGPYNNNGGQGNE